MLTPLGPRIAEPARRKRLVDKRNHLLKLANNLAQPVDDELTLEHVQYAPPSCLHATPCFSMLVPVPLDVQSISHRSAVGNAPHKKSCCCAVF